MIKKGRHLIKSHMSMEYSFTGVRLKMGTLTPVDWNLTVDLVATGKKNKPKEELEYDAGISYQKIYFWLETNLPGVLAVDVGNEDDFYIANLVSNIVLFCPDIPSDDLLIQLLHAKISSLASPNLIVGEMHLKGSDTSLHYTFDCSAEEYILPMTTAEYYAEGKARDNEPWWFRDDGFCFEFTRPLDSEETDEELFKDVIDPMDDFHRIIAEVAESTVSIVGEPAKIIQVEKWKPRKVD